MLLVDGTSLAWRAACGFPARIRSRSGADITAVFGFFALLRKTHREILPGSEVVVCFDSEAVDNPRRADFIGYKPLGPAEENDRAPFAWFDAIWAGLDAVGVQWCEARAYEADDDIATLVGTLGGRSAGIMSSDHDFLQLVGRRVRVITPRRTYRVADVLDRYSVHPRQWCDFRALTGDPSDKIPGVWGIGPKRAAYVLGRNRVLETARIPDTWWGRRLREQHDQALRWRELMRLRPNQDVGLEPTGHRTKELPLAARICEVLELWD